MSPYLEDKKSLERATGIEPVLPTWEGKYSTLYFQHLQNRPIKMCVHALHTVHALPDLRIAGGRFGGRFLSCVPLRECRIEAYCFVPEASRYSRSVMTNYLRAKTSTVSSNVFQEPSFKRWRRRWLWSGWRTRRR